MVIFESLRLNRDITDNDFDAIYPWKVRRLAASHWTPVSVAKTAAEFLVTRPGTRVLDIGSGAGKFCMIGAVLTTGHFTGIEQRSDLVELSKRLSGSHSLKNVEFINANVTSIEFNKYDAFYLYNSFQENIDSHNRIDDAVLLNPALYNAYTTHTQGQLSSLPPGTRLVTYYTSVNVIPQTFTQTDSRFDGHLNFWEKKS